MQHMVQQLVQLPGGEPHHEAAQIFGDVLGDLRLTGLQRLGKLHRHFVAAVGGQHGGDGQQGSARHTAHHDVLTDLDEVGEVGGDVQQVGIFIVLGLIQKVLHAHGLQHPGGGGFQVIQKDVADGLALVQLPPEDVVLQMELVAQLRKTNSQIDINIFRSAENVNLETIIGYRKGDKQVSFLDEYNQ